MFTENYDGQIRFSVITVWWGGLPCFNHKELFTGIRHILVISHIVWVMHIVHWVLRVKLIWTWENGREKNIWRLYLSEVSGNRSKEYLKCYKRAEGGHENLKVGKVCRTQHLGLRIDGYTCTFKNWHNYFVSYIGFCTSFPSEMSSCSRNSEEGPYNCRGAGRFTTQNDRESLTLWEMDKVSSSWANSDFRIIGKEYGIHATTHSKYTGYSPCYCPGK